MFVNRDKVKLTNLTYGQSVEGALHLPDLNFYSSKGMTSVPQKVDGTYSLYTLKLPSGSLYRTYGTLTVSE